MYLGIHPRLLLGCVSGVCYSVNLRQSRACHFTYLREVRVEEAERSGTVTSKGNRVERSGVNSPTVTMKWDFRAVAGH